jgi:hypothetical protein
MVLNYYSDYGEEKKYYITYKDLSDKECLVDGEALSKSHAEDLFRRVFHPSCKIIKIQTSDEWVKDVGEEIANNLMKNVKNLEDLMGCE